MASFPLNVVNRLQNADMNWHYEFLMDLWDDSESVWATLLRWAH